VAEAAERDLATVAEDPDLANLANHAVRAVVVAGVGAAVGEQDRVEVVAVVVEQDQVEVADHRPAPVVVGAVAVAVVAAVVEEQDPASAPLHPAH